MFELKGNVPFHRCQASNTAHDIESSASIRNESISTCCCNICIAKIIYKGNGIVTFVKQQPMGTESRDEESGLRLVLLDDKTLFPALENMKIF